MNNVEILAIQVRPLIFQAKADVSSLEDFWKIQLLPLKQCTVKLRVLKRLI